jgi:hypothetical protein
MKKKKPYAPSAPRTTLQEEVLKFTPISSFSDFNLSAGEFEIGKVHELFFDDNIWAVRYFAADAGSWISGKKVLISPSVLGEPDSGTLRIPVSVRELKIQKAPALDLDAPVSRLHQIRLNEHYGWMPYWAETDYHDISESSREVVSGLSADEETAADSHLFSTLEMIDYTVHALDGEKALVEDFIVDTEDWVIYYLVAEIGEPGDRRRVLLSTDWVSRISREEERVYTDLSVSMIEGSPEYDPAVPVDRDYEYKLYDYYGRPMYWGRGDVVEDDL